MGWPNNYAEYAYDINGNVVGLAADRSGTSDGNTIHFAEWIDPRDWTGFDATGNNDNSTILQAAIDESAYKTRTEYGFGQSKRLRLPPGRIVFSTALIVKQNLWMEGTFGADGGTELRWAGANAVNAIETVNTVDVSMMHFANFRLKDFRTTPTSGKGFHLTRVKNGLTMHRLQVFGFPLVQVYIGADTGQVTDCVEIENLWLNSSVATAQGLLLERVQNNVIVNNVKSDLTTTPANDGYVIRVQQVANDDAVIEITNVKHESNNRCPTITFPQITKGNLTVRNVIQRNPSSGAAGAGDVIQIGAAAAGTAFVYDNSGSGITTGSGSESGSRITMENISGAYHSDWTGASGAAVIRGVGTGAVVYGDVRRVTMGLSGRLYREVQGNSQPNASIYGNVGDVYARLDATSSSCSRWIKQSGSATNTGWAPLTPDTQSPAFSATFACNLQSGNYVTVGTLTANITHSVPTNVPAKGVPVQYDFTQNGTGGYGITWSSTHKGAWPTASGTAGQKKTVRGVSDGTNIIFTSDSGWY